MGYLVTGWPTGPLRPRAGCSSKVHAFPVLPGVSHGACSLALPSLVVFLVHGASDSSASTRLEGMPSTLAPGAVASGPVEMVHNGLAGFAQLISGSTECPEHRPGAW